MDILSEVGASAQLVILDFLAVGLHIAAEVFGQRVEEVFADGLEVAFEGSFIVGVLFLAAVGVDAESHVAVFVFRLCGIVFELDHGTDAAYHVTRVIGHDMAAVGGGIVGRAAHVAVAVGQHGFLAFGDGIGQRAHTVGGSTARVNEEDGSQHTLVLVALLQPFGEVARTGLAPAFVTHHHAFHPDHAHILAFGDGFVVAVGEVIMVVVCWAAVVIVILILHDAILRLQPCRTYHVAKHERGGISRHRVEHPLRHEDSIKQVWAFAHGKKFWFLVQEQK